MLLKKLKFIILITTLLFLFQNCGQYNFKSHEANKSSSSVDCTNCTSEDSNSEDYLNSDGDKALPDINKLDFYDNFESADMLSTNTSGFKWARNNRTSIISNNQTVVWNNGVINNGPFDNKDWQSKSGSHALRFRYAPGAFMAEQRFDLGGHYKDLWLGYWIRVPINFTHGSLNNKFLSLWPETYDRAGTVTWQTRPNGYGGANLVVQDGGVTNGEALSVPFIRSPEDRGRWMQVIVRVKSASTERSKDGVIEFYRRWDNEAQFTKLHEITNANTWDISSSEQGISKGYILGWANDAYDEETEWLVDDFMVSKQQMLTAE